MFNFITIYRRVDDEQLLEDFFTGTHLPLLEQLPGLRRKAVGRVLGKPGGQSRFHLVVEATFDSAESFHTSLLSKAGRQLMPALKAWSDAKLITWFYSDSFEELVTDQADDDESSDQGSESPP